MVVAYEGTGYAGFQAQANAPTIQGELETAIANLTGAITRIRGASRTDSGAHADGQVVDFLTSSRLPPQVIRSALNHHLPDSIRVLKIEEVATTFHSRRSAIWREYRYSVLNRAVLAPLLRRTHHLETGHVDISRMRQAASSLIGHRDFRAVATGHPEDRSAVRRVIKWEVTKQPADGDIVVIDCIANGFLRHQIRRVNSILLEIGKGKRPIHAMAEALAGRTGGMQPAPTLPARGLCLRNVHYSENEHFLKVADKHETD